MVKQSISAILDRAAFAAFLLVIMGVVFVYGVAVGEFHCFPYAWIQEAVRAGILAVDPGRPHHLQPAHYDFDGVRIHDADAVTPGVTLLTGYWPDDDWAPGVRLIDLEGNVLHAWNTDPSRIWPESPHDDRTAGTKNNRANYVHGCHLFPNGDILFNVEYLGLTRMNAAGEILWKLPYRTHHSVHRADDGNFWVCGMKWLDRSNPSDAERAARYGIALPATEDFAVKVSPDGRILREISLLDALERSGYGYLIDETPITDDIMHTNDVEPLPRALAEQFPAFNPGDLLVSCREINAVFVVDAETERVKWLSQASIQQHDPDFLPDGTIQVFDNRRPWYGGTRIYRIKPGEQVITVDYPRNNRTDFLTMAGGKAQRFAGGNLLITEARRGRVFEVNPTGRVVWEWVAPRYDENTVPEVLEGTRYSLTPEQIAAW